jgi:CHAT domain-containing protein
MGGMHYPASEDRASLGKFYAGSRALLVSHWTVQSDAAVALTARMLALSGKGVIRAEAHRQAMMAMIDKGPVKSARPALWAPFVVVGDGGVSTEIGSLELLQKNYIPRE